MDKRIKELEEYMGYEVAESWIEQLTELGQESFIITPEVAKKDPLVMRSAVDNSITGVIMNQHRILKQYNNVMTVKKLDPTMETHVVYIGTGTTRFSRLYKVDNKNPYCIAFYVRM